MDTKLSALAAYRLGKLRLPSGYHIGCDAEELTLHRHDGSKVAAFTTHVPPSVVAKTAEEDYYNTPGRATPNQQRGGPQTATSWLGGASGSD
jgi:hypothetical protein